MSRRRGSAFGYSPWNIALAAGLAALLIASAPAAGAVEGDSQAQERPPTKYFVHVLVPSWQSAVDLQIAGFDLAGVNFQDGTAGFVVTEEQMTRLRSMGFSYTIEASNDDPVTIAALQDYTDPVELNAFLDQVVAAYPNLARKEILQETLFEGQSQYVLKITKDVNLPNDRPTFVLDSQHHAREVMTPEIARDMIDYLTLRYDTDSQVRRWVDNINIWVVGSVNPDGAWHVFNGDNMWRKNRHPGCPVDPNRNYPFMWNSCNGSSGSCTDETYRGFSPGSEPETAGMLALAQQAHAFFALSYHTYGEYIMYSYGCTSPNEQAAMDEVARALNSILQNDNGVTNQYRVGPIGSTIYLVDGGSVDTWYAQHGTYAYTIEASCCSFQPDYATWRNITVQRHRTAWQFFLDKTLDGPQIRGKITDGYTGSPVNARVEVAEVTFTHGESPRFADSRGLYHWLARTGQTYNVTYSKPGYCSATRSVTVGTGPADVNVTLVQPTPPSWVAAVGNGDNRIDVSWAPAVNATQYRVLRSLDSGGPYEEIALVDAPATSYSDIGVSGQVPYHYVVRALQPCESGNSTEGSGSTTGTCTAGPAFAGLASVTNAQESTCALHLSWTPASARCGGRITHEVYRSTTSPFTPSPANRIAAGLEGGSFTDHAALADSVPYFYVVRAIDAFNGTNDGNTVTLNGSPTGASTSGTWADNGGDDGTPRLTGAAPWSAQATGGKTGPKVYATGIYTNNLCSALTSPPISVQASSVLSFASKYDIEGDWDAGIVEVATGPGFTNWTKLTTVNYPNSLTNTGNACGFPKSFAGTVFSRYYATPAYPATDYTGSLGAYAGQDIRLRWRLSSDSTGTGKGWWIDDIAVTDAVFRSVCAPGVAANPKEGAGPVLASRSPAGTSVDLSFDPACGAADNVVYWGTGPIAGAVDWTSASCGLGNSGGASFDPGDPPEGSFFYFVLVGQNPTVEGSFGQSYLSGVPSERPEAVGVGACDRSQDLSGTCP